MNVFSTAPHRMMFFAGSLQLVFLMLFWLSELLGRYTTLWAPLTLSIPASQAHIFLMIYGLFILFILGFLMTTYPRWMNKTAIEEKQYIPPFWLLSSGILCFYTGLFISKELLVLAALLMLAGWGMGIRALIMVYIQAKNTDRRYETSLNTALIFGWVGVLLFSLYLMTEQIWLLQAAQTVGIWLFLLPLIVTVCHRMIPFFSTCVLENYTVVQPIWALAVLWAGVVAHTLLVLTEYTQWLWLADLPLAGLALYHSWQWKLRRSFEVRLLAVLHISFLWFGIAMSMYTLQSLAALFDHHILGFAPLHALTVGFFASLIIAMVTRVTMGHSGRPLELDRYTWLIFLGMNFTAMIRIANEIPLFSQLSSYWNPIAAISWLICVALWVWRYAPMYLRPRVDGRPG